MNLRKSLLLLCGIIIRCECDSDSPEYMKGEDLRYCLPRRGGWTNPLPLNNPSEWPPAKDLDFNESQYEAFKAALTHEFVVIQGMSLLDCLEN